MDRVLEALWETQWSTAWAAENTVCAYHCLTVPYQDQQAHHPDCDFVKLWADLGHVWSLSFPEIKIEFGLGPKTPVGR